MMKKREIFAVIAAIVISLILIFVANYIPWGNIFTPPYSGWMVYITRALICITFIYVLKLGKTAGVQREGLGKGLLYGIPFYIIGIGSAILSNWGTDLTGLEFISWSNLIVFTVSMLLVSINEEVWLRALVLNLLHTHFGNTKKKEWLAVIVAAFIFGMLHLINLGHMNIVNVLVQVVNAFAGGILFGAIFIRTRNIIALITIHFIVDWVSLVIGECFRSTNTILNVKMSPLLIVITILGGVVVPVVAAWKIMNKE